MDPQLITWMFVGGGALLIVLEAVLPGGVSFFLGAGGLLVGALRALGIVTDPVVSVVLWLILSAALVFALRDLLVSYFGGESSVKVADEDFEAMDQVVDVVEPITPLDTDGRIRFRGATWQARSVEGRLPAGSKARIKYRENLTWVVEPATGYIAEPLE